MSFRARRWLTRLLITIVLIGAIWGKVRFEAGEALGRAQEFERVQYTRLAVVAYRHTVRWYSPGSEPVGIAVERLETMGDELSAAGKVALALEAYRALRSGIYSIRSTYTPYGDVLPALNRKIATLMANQEFDGVESTDAAERIAHHEALLAADNAPDIFWSLVATSAFVLWCAFLLLLSHQGFDDELGTLKPSVAIKWGIGVLGTTLVWTVGLWLA